MTLVELRTACKREARIKSADNLDTLVDEIIIEILRDYTNRARYGELLTENVAITLVAAQAAYSLPDDYQNLETLRFARGPVSVNSPGVYRELDPIPPVVSRTYQNGFPKYYRLLSNSRISLWPYGTLLVTDSLLIDYYIDPASIFSDDADEFPVPRLESAVKKDTIARLQRFYADTQGAQGMDADAKSSYVAGRGGSG